MKNDYIILPEEEAKMSRRSFLKLLGVTGLVLATPKMIFDVGKNLTPEVFPQMFALGERNGTWIYVKAAESLPQYSLVSLSCEFNASLLDSRDISMAPKRIGAVAKGDIKKGECQWISVGDSLDLKIRAF